MAYTVTYNGNTSTAGNVPVDSTQYLTTEVVTVIGNMGYLAKDGYAFIGWNTAADGSGVTYHPGDTFAIALADVVLYATWIAHAYTVNKLITNAFYLSKVRSKDFQTVGGDDITVGLELLNEVLSELCINTKMIPYYKEYVTAAVIGQEKYFIPNLVEPFSVTFNMTTVRYATSQLTRRQFHSTTRVDGIIAMPFNSSFERTLNGCDLYLQFLPAETYPLKIWGKFSYEFVTHGDLINNMLLTYDLFMIRYLKHLLAKEICNYYGVEMPPQIEQVLQRISDNLNDMNPIDLTSRSISLYNEKNSLNWAEVNLGRGFTPC